MLDILTANTVNEDTTCAVKLKYGDALTELSSANDPTLMYDPNEPASVHSQRWNSDTNLDLVFAHTVGSGCVGPSLSDFNFFVLENHPKIALNQY